MEIGEIFKGFLCYCGEIGLYSEDHGNHRKALSRGETWPSY